MPDTLCCLNCKQPMRPEEAKLFAEVFVCPSCYAMAEHFWQRLTKELRQLQVMAKESIRVCLLEGKFHFPEGAAAQEVSKRAVLESILAMEEARTAKDPTCSTQNTTSTQTPPSMEPTPPHVLTLAALGKSSSPKGSPRS